MNRQSIELAAQRISPFVTRTPLVASPWLSGASGATVWLKLETAQVTGSFKARGAMNALLAMKERSPEVDLVVCASAGNHGQALAWAGGQLGIRVRAHVPAAAADTKKHAMRTYGAALIEADDYDAAEEAGRADAVHLGVPYVSPYNNDDVIAGQGTIALEMLTSNRGSRLVTPSAADSSAAARWSRKIGNGRRHHARRPSFGIHHGLGDREITTVRVRPTLADALAGSSSPAAGRFRWCSIWSTASHSSPRDRSKRRCAASIASTISSPRAPAPWRRRP
jgi:hypothetical protein